MATQKKGGLSDWVRFRVTPSMKSQLRRLAPLLGVKSPDMAARKILAREIPKLMASASRSDASGSAGATSPDASEFVNAVELIHRNLSEMNLQLRASGNNINQIARSLNLIAAGEEDIDRPDEEEIRAAYEDVMRKSDEVRRLIEEVGPILVSCRKHAKVLGIAA